MTNVLTRSFSKTARRTQISEAEFKALVTVAKTVARDGFIRQYVCYGDILSLAWMVVARIHRRAGGSRGWIDVCNTSTQVVLYRARALANNRKEMIKQPRSVALKASAERKYVEMVRFEAMHANSGGSEDVSHHMDLVLSGTVKAPFDAADVAYERDIMQRDLHRAIDRLPSELRDVSLLLLQDHDSAEIATKLAISRKEAQNRVAEVHSRLRDVMKCHAA